VDTNRLGLQQWGIFGGRYPGGLDPQVPWVKALYCFSTKFENTKSINIQYEKFNEPPHRKNSKFATSLQGLLTTIKNCKSYVMCSMYQAGSKIMYLWYINNWYWYTEENVIKSILKKEINH